MTILPLTGGGDVFAQLRGHLDRAGAHAAAGRPRPHRPRRRGRPLRAPARDGRRSGGAVAGHRRRAAPRLDPLRARSSGRAGSTGIVITWHDRVEVPATGTTRAKAVAMTQQCADALGATIVEHTADWHMLQRVFLDDLDPRPQRRREPTGARRELAVRIGIVCPYSFDVPGGVQFHVRDLAEHFLGQGHHASRARPGRRGHPAARLRRVRRARGPGALQRVGGPAQLRAADRGAGRPLAGGGRLRRRSTSTSRSRPASRCSRCGRPRARSWRPSTPRTCGRGRCRRPTRCCGPAWRRSTGGSPCPRTPAAPSRRHLGGDAVVIPNGVNVVPVRRRRARADGGPAPRRRPTIAFLGRIDEPRKGLPVLAAAHARGARRAPGRAGPGGRAGRRRGCPRAARPGRGRCHRVPRAWSATRTRPSLLSSVDLYVAPHTGGESFGIVLVEAMSAGRAGRGERPAGVRAGARRRAGRRDVRQRGQRRPGPPAAAPARATRRSASGSARPGTVGPGCSTGRSSPRTSWRSTTRSPTAAEDARSDPAADTRWTRLLRGRRGGED